MPPAVAPAMRECKGFSFGNDMDDVNLWRSTFSHNAPMTAVVLLRAPSQDSPDRYEECFKSIGYHALSVPVLETVLTNLEELKRTMRAYSTTRTYKGVIITSARACGAWGAVVKDLLVEPSSTEVPVPGWYIASVI
jgi:hypothetical protein